jgi:tetratricopeptide (TPR) repeat protein
MDAIKKAIRIYPQDPSFYCELAEEHLDCRRYSEAFEAVKQALELHPNFGRAYYEQAQIFLKQAYNDEALQPLETSATLTPNDPDVWLALGVYREEPGSVGSPEDAYIKCLKLVGCRRKLSPFNDTAESYRVLCFQNLGTLRLGQKRYAEAKTFYHQAFVSDTKHQFTDRLRGEIDYCEKSISNSLSKI